MCISRGRTIQERIAELEKCSERRAALSKAREKIAKAKEELGEDWFSQFIVGVEELVIDKENNVVYSREVWNRD